MIDHRHKQVKEQRTPTSLHLHLHCAATLECIATANDEREVVRSQLGIACGRVGVGKAGREEDGAALDPGLESLFFESQALEFGESVAMRGALGSDVSIDGYCWVDEE